ncbi:MAG: aminoglycoside phosphotransferase family protein [Micropruina sp.]|uniref:phosphotransferase family protein n=1 Tax=Micropruina sp. TaxID=2737536 RepID=UPI0039E5BC08
MTTDRAIETWAAGLARALGVPDASIVRLPTSSDAELLLTGALVIKLHTVRTDPAALAARLQLAAANAQFVPPATPRVFTAPDGRPATIWPKVPVTKPDADPQPWADAGALLAGLHRVLAPNELPRHGWPERMERAVERAPATLRGVGERLLGQLRRVEPDEPDALLHGDWHLGQLGRWDDGWRLLDIDDVGVGDPAWDLARPAGFWACGLLDDADWHTFLDAYHAAGGPAVPASGDPWPALDLPARCAVFVAAVRASRNDHVHSRRTAEALSETCRRMAQ